MILSVSRRTDIPAFYAEWFMNRLKAGFVYVRNPFNIYQVSEVPLTPDNVDAIVFWTKNSKPLHQYLSEIDNMGYKYYFQFTITPYGKEIEENIEKKEKIVETFKNLSEKTGKEKVILRYDPVILNDKYTIDFHIKSFDRLCSILSSYTEKVVISFLDDYKKISKNIKCQNIKEITEDEMNIIAENFSDIAGRYNLILESCAEEINLKKYNINHGKCIDDELIGKITNSVLDVSKDGQRTACGCVKCIDIGEYNTCLHKCLYCYANIDKESAFENYRRHDKYSPVLIGSIDRIKDKITKRNQKDTKSLKKVDEVIAKQGSIEDMLNI